MPNDIQLGTLCYVKSRGKTLMLHRTKKADDMHEGKWVGLGGKMEVGESPEECVIREVYEESGLRIDKPELRGLLTFPGFHDGTTWYGFLFVALTFSGSLIASNEGELQWVRDRDLFDLPMHEGDYLFLKWLQQPDFFSAKFVYMDGKLTDHDVVFYTANGSGNMGVKKSARPVVNATEQRASFQPTYLPEDDGYCWMCGSPVRKQHCKIICQVCGFMRDCSDP